MRSKTGFLGRAGAALMLVALFGCGGGGGPTSSTTTTLPPTPAATITAVGAGARIINPSLDARYDFALETPLRLTETACGSADWNFARFQLFQGNREIERNEIGSDVIRAAGFGRISANSNRVVTAVFRINSDDFDRIDITL